MDAAKDSLKRKKLRRRFEAEPQHFTLKIGKRLKECVQLIIDARLQL